MNPDPRDEAVEVLREFVQDVKLAFGTGDGLRPLYETVGRRGDEIDKTTLHLEWPDLEVTYHNACVALEKLR